MNNEGGTEYLDAAQAVKYLAERWGLESYSVTAFRALKKRWGLVPDLHTKNSSLWTRETLDKIPKPDRSKPRPTRRKKTEQNEDNSEKAA